MKYEVSVIFDLNAKANEDFPDANVDHNNIEEQLADHIKWFFESELNDIFAESEDSTVDVEISNGDIKIYNKEKQQ